MSSDNPSSADNQQERPSSSSWLDQIPNDLGNWVAGFVDGEGSFNVPIRRDHQSFNQAVSRHLSASGKSRSLRSSMNRDDKRRYGESYRLDVLEDWESSEAIRRAPPLKLGG